MPNDDTLQDVLDAILYYQTGAARFPTLDEWAQYGGTVRRDTPIGEPSETGDPRSTSASGFRWSTAVGPDGADYCIGRRLLPDGMTCGRIDFARSLGVIDPVPELLVAADLYPIDAEEIAAALRRLKIEGIVVEAEPPRPIALPFAPFRRSDGKILRVAVVETSTSQGIFDWRWDLGEDGIGRWFTGPVTLATEREIHAMTHDARAEYRVEVSIGCAAVPALSSVRHHLNPAPSWTALTTKINGGQRIPSATHAAKSTVPDRPNSAPEDEPSADTGRPTLAPEQAEGKGKQPRRGGRPPKEWNTERDKLIAAIAKRVQRDRKDNKRIDWGELLRRNRDRLPPTWFADTLRGQVNRYLKAYVN